MTIKQKIFSILNTINDQQSIIPKGDPIRLNPNDKSIEIFEEIDPLDIRDILIKLDEEKVIKIIQKADYRHEYTTMGIVSGKGKELFIYGYFLLEISKNFYEHLNEFKEELSYKEEKEDDIIYELSFKDISRKLFIKNLSSNKHRQIKKFDYDSDNIKILKYLLDNPERDIHKEELEDKIGIKLQRSAHEIARDLGFSGKLKELFCFTSKNTIKMLKRIPVKDLKDNQEFNILK